MIKQISIGLRDEQLNSLAEMADRAGVSQAEIIRRLVDDARQNRQRLIDLSRAFLRGLISENEFAREVSVLIILS